MIRLLLPLFSLLFSFGCEAHVSSAPASNDDGRCHETVFFWAGEADVRCPPGSHAEVLNGPEEVTVTCRCPPSGEVSDGR